MLAIGSLRTAYFPAYTFALAAISPITTYMLLRNVCLSPFAVSVPSPSHVLCTLLPGFRRPALGGACVFLATADLLHLFCALPDVGIGRQEVRPRSQVEGIQKVKYLTFHDSSEIHTLSATLTYILRFAGRCPSSGLGVDTTNPCSCIRKLCCRQTELGCDHLFRSGVCAVLSS